MLEEQDTTKLAKELGKRIRQLRKEKGLSLAQLAYEAEPQLTRFHLSHIERGTRFPSVVVLFGLAERLEVEVFELFLLGEGERTLIAELVRLVPDH